MYSASAMERFRVAATQSSDAARPGRWRRRLPEHVQLRLDMLRGRRRIDLNLTRSRSARLKLKEKDEEDQAVVQEGRHRGSRVLVGERGRVSAWSDSGDDVSD